MMIYTNVKGGKAKLRPKKEREEYEAWLTKHGVEKKKKKEKHSFEPWTYSIGQSVRKTEVIPSLSTMEGIAALKPRQVYTGNKILGIGTLHKSNAIPVFSQEEAQDMAKMRR